MCVCVCKRECGCIYIYIYIYIRTHTYIWMYIPFFFIIQCMKEHAIPCPYQPPTRSDNTVSVVQGCTANPGATKQILPPDRVFQKMIYIYISIYMPDQLKGEIALYCIFIFIFSAVWDF